MVAYLLSPVLLALLALLPNEAFCSEATLSSRLLLERSRHLQSLGSLMANMTVDSALNVLQSRGRVTEPFVSLLQQKLGRARRAQLRARTVQAPPATTKAPDASVDSAREALNGMIYEVQEKYEAEHRSCCEYETTRRSLIEEAAQDIALFNAEAAQARTGMLRAQSDITRAEQSIPQITASLKDHNGKCSSSIKALSDQLSVVKQDVDTMSSILNQTTCASTASTAKNSLLLMRCPHPCTGAESTLLRGESMVHTLTNLHSAAAQGLLHSTMAEAVSWREMGPGEALLQEQMQRHLMEEHNAAGRGHSAHGRRQRVSQAPTFQLPGGPCTKPQAVDPKSRRCTPGDANCRKLRERFLLIQSRISDQKEELETEIRQQTESCRNMAKELQDQIDEQQRNLNEANSRLARWVSVQNRADEQSRLKTKERTTMEQEFKEMTATCQKNYQGFEEEECGLKKIRLELGRMKSQGAQNFVDCELSPWSASPCSANCGGGTQTLRRSIVTQPVNGAKCLPLTQQRRCNPQACPVNCRMGDWEQWSACTAACGGGITQRGRLIQVKPVRGGQPCGESSEVRSCNMQSCNQDCVLTQWTAWSQCSKECGGGRMLRHRFVEKAATGSGSCPSSKSSQRLESRGCNTQACPSDLVCEAKLDVVLLLDGSGSLGEDGWNATKKAGQMLVNSLMGAAKSNVRVSVLLFSGPGSWFQVMVCSGAFSWFRPADPLKDCDMQWVARFGDSMGTTATAIDKLTWPAGSTLTATALGLAEAELNNGRPDANAVVIVVTDGRPTSVPDTNVMAERIKRKARLVFVPVTPAAPLEWVRNWASDPDDQNIVVVNTFGELESTKTVDSIVSTMCPDVKAKQKDAR